MDYQEEIDGFSNDFKNILLNIKDIENKKEKIVENLSQLKTQYSELIKTNTKKIFLFCLDSFFYQYKIYSAEYRSEKEKRDTFYKNLKPTQDEQDKVWSMIFAKW